MLNRIRTAQKSNEGFTLIELLIVIVVLGILAGIVVFGVSTFQKDSTDAACKANAKSAEIAAQAYNAKTGSYPTAGAITSSSVLITGNYLKSVPVPAITLDGSGNYQSGC